MRRTDCVYSTHRVRVASTIKCETNAKNLQTKLTRVCATRNGVTNDHEHQCRFRNVYIVKYLSVRTLASKNFQRDDKRMIDARRLANE